MRKATTALVLATALALAALPSRTDADQDVTIREVDFRLEPSSFTATVGEVVHFTVTNVGTRPHNVEVERESANIEQKLFDANLQPGETRTADFTFTQAGTWEMYCPVGNHKAMGMTGQVTVLAAAATTAPAAPPQPAAAAKPAAPAPAAVPPPAVPVAQPPPTPTPSTARVPSQLPRTGGGAGVPIAAIAAGVGLLIGGLLVLRRR
jgi:LPXTG-motif cell wall-anchored protein